jgi:hypothetical protein
MQRKWHLRGIEMSNEQDSKKDEVNRRSRSSRKSSHHKKPSNKDTLLSDENFVSFFEKSKRRVKGLDFILGLTLFIILGAVIIAVVFSDSDSALSERSAEDVVTLEGVSVPTLSAVTGERSVLSVESNIIPDAVNSKIFLFEVTGSTYDISDADLFSYAHFLIDSESFLPIDFDRSSVNFMLAKIIDERHVFQIASHHDGGEVMVEYAVVTDAGIYSSLRRFEQVEALLDELNLDARVLLDAANGLNEDFWEFATTAIMDQLVMLDADERDSGEFLNRYLEIFEGY